MSDKEKSQRSISFRRLLVVGVSSWAILATAEASAAAIVDTVAFSGQEVAPGTTFGDFGLVSMNNNGAVAFGARTFGVLAGNGIWSGTPGNLSLVARQGDLAPGTSGGETFSLGGFSLGAPLISDSGEVAFKANLGNVPAGTGNEGVWAGTPGDVQLVARRFESAPGSTGIRTIRYSRFGALGQSDNGQIVVGSSVLISSIGGVIRTTGTGVWTGPSDGLELVAEDAVATAKSDAPGAPATVNFLRVSPSSTVNNQGQTAFTATLEDPFDRTVNEDNDRGLWFGNGTNTRLVAREGDAAGTGFVFEDFSGAEVNNPGQVAFKATLRPDSGGFGQRTDSVWLDDGAGPALVARVGDLAPGAGTGTVFQNLINHTLGDNGQVAIRATVTGTGVNNSNSFGVWLGDETGLQLAARAGEPAPGTDRAFTSFARPLLNANGDLFLFAALTGSSEGVFVDVGDGLEKLLAADDTIEVAPGDERTVADISFSPDAFNNLGQALVFVAFTDGSEGLFRVGLDGAPEPEPEPVPEPSSILILSGGLFAMAFVTRRRRSRCS